MLFFSSMLSFRHSLCPALLYAGGWLPFLSYRLFAIWLLVGFDHCQEVPSSGRRKTENSLPGHCRKLLLLAAWLSLESLTIVFCLASSDQLVLISGYIMFLDNFPILAHMSRKSSILSCIHLSYTIHTPCILLFFFFFKEVD